MKNNSQNHPRMVMTEVRDTTKDILSPMRRHWIILFLLLVGLATILLGKNTVAESTPIIEKQTAWIVRATIEAEEASVVDPYSKYDGHAVPHPRREPDALVTIKISRYDPQLGGPNCFRWGWDPVKGYYSCLSGLSNGERWEVNYEISIACDERWPYYTIVEIDGQLLYCKDH